jgi:hypothetical protein
VLSLASAEAAIAATHALDLRSDAASVFTTRAPDQSLGRGVAPAGDVNGDGNPDLLIGAPDSGRNGRKGSGSAYVVFGLPAFAPRLPLDPLGDRGFRIDGAPPEVKASTRDIFGEDSGPLTDTAGYALAGIGDVNGDGLADVAVSAPDASPKKRVAAGAVYVVFGKRSTERVDLKDLGDGGYRIAGQFKTANTGFALAATGDVNGDGRGDLLVGTFPGLSAKAQGNLYLVFSRPEPAPVDLAHLGAGGIAIRGEWPSGPYLAALGDVNGDGLGDVIVGAPPSTKDGKGRAYVIFGRAAPGELRLASLGSAGYSIRDSGRTDFAGNLGGLVGGPGDVNGDGRPDLLVGGGDVTHVLFGDGSSKAVDLDHAAGRSLRIVGLAIGFDSAGTGDANGDGRADVLLGASFDSPRCRDQAGSATVVYGRAKPGRLSLGNLGPGGYRIDGVGRDSHAGDAVAWAGDLDGDGRSDVLLGAPGTGAHGRAYLVRGRSGGVPKPPGGPCLRLRVPPQSLGHIARTRRLRVIVTSRSSGAVVLTAHVKHHGVVAEGRAYFPRAGTKQVRLRLTRSGRQVVHGRTRLLVRVLTEGYPFATPRASVSAVLTR